jgi:hypothetical protein
MAHQSDCLYLGNDWLVGSSPAELRDREKSKIISQVYTFVKRYLREKKMPYTPSENVTWKTVSTGTVLLNLESGEYYTLNNTGSLIWSDLLEKKLPSEIVEHLSTEFDCEIETAQADVDEYLNYLLGEKLLNPGDTTRL